MALTKVTLIQDGTITVDHLSANHNITTDNIGEGTNQFYTDARVANYLSTNNYQTAAAGYFTGVTNDTVNNKLVFAKSDSTSVDVDLTQYIDDTNLARLVSGTVDAATGIATFTRDDATTFTVDFSSLLDDTNDYVSSASFNALDGVLTLNRLGGGTVTVDLDGRYLTSETDTQTLSWADATNTLSISNGNSVVLTGFADASHTHTFASLTSKPTTISGYGITDAITTSNIGSQSVSSATTSTNLGSYYTADDWLRATSDNNPVKFYGNTYQMTFRVDGTSEAYAGVGNYAFVWTYGGSDSAQRRMLLGSDGRLWTNYHGWMDEAFLGKTAKATDSYDSDYATTSAFMQSFDTRNNASTPETHNASAGIHFDFKHNSTNGLSDGGSYNGVMYWRKYGSTTDWSGGGAKEIAYTDNGNLWHRYGTSTSWGSWRKILDTSNYTSVNVDAVTLDGIDSSQFVRSDAADTITGDILINTGNTQNGIRFRTTSGDFVGRYSNYVSLYNQISTDEIRIYDGGYIQLDGTVRAPIVYDSNNTAYYSDPASTSNLYTVSAQDAIRTDRYEDISGNFMFQKGTNAGTTSTRHLNLADTTIDPSDIGTSHVATGITWGRRTDNNPYYIIRCAPAYNNGYSTHSRLDLSWHTGIQIGAASTYGGTRFFNNSSFTGSEIMRVGSGNNNVYINYTGEAGSDFRAPIFYDSNNTGYYVDPASTSNLAGLTVANQISGSVSGTSNAVAITGYGNGNFTFYQSPNAFDAFSGWHNYFIGNHGDGSNYYHTTIAMPFWGPPRYSRRESGTLRGPYEFWTSERDINSSANITAPAYYDYNDTGYYLDLTSTSSGLLRGRLRFNDYGAGITGYYTSTRLQTIFNMGASYEIAVDGSSASGAYGLYWSHQNAGGLGGANNLASHGILIIENGSWKGAWGGGSLRTPGDVRAPIFYDYNNTGYYCNPASTSLLSELNANHFGINNSNDSTRDGISLYGGYSSGEPTYGLLFTGTSLGTHGSVTGSWATYFTMNNDTSRGWIFRRVGSGNAASISAGGVASFNGDVIAYYSDMRLKTKIADIENPLDKVMSLNGFIYEPNEVAESYGYEKERKVGVSAQEVQAVLPEAVKDAPIGDGYLTVQYDKLVPLLIEAIKEQQKQIDELKSLIK